MMLKMSINKKSEVRKLVVKVCACLIIFAYIMQMTGMFSKHAIMPAEAETQVEKIYTFGSQETLSYLKWKGSTESVKANPKSITNKSVLTAFEKETMGFCLNRKGNPPSADGETARYSRELTKREYSPIYYAYFSGNKYGVSGKKLWYSTQVAIWCMLGQISSAREKGLDQTEALTYNGNNSDILNAVKALVKDSEKNLVKPHINGSERIRILGVPKYKINGNKTKLTITGLSTNVAECDVTMKSGNAKISVDGKKITITADYVENEQLKFTIEAEKLYEKYSGEAYFLGGGYQNVGYVGNSVSKKVSAKRTLRFKAESKTGSITIKKHAYIDGEKLQSGLEGAVFSISSSSFEEDEKIEVVTDKDGSVVVDNLPYGTYEITEIQAPEGYSLDNEEGEINSIVVELSEANKDYVYECYNTYVPTGFLGIWKADIDDVTKRLTGAKFICKSVSSDFEVVVPEHHTAKGIYEIELPYGDYILTEEKAPSGYVLDEENCEWHFTLDDSCLNRTVNILVENSLPKGGVSILKKDSQTGEMLEGAEFELYCKNDIEINGIVRCKAGEVLATQSTDKNGLAVFNDLYYGDYYVVENKAPNNYLLNENNKYEFSVGESDVDIVIEVDNTAISTPTPKQTESLPTQTIEPTPEVTVTPSMIASSPTVSPESTGGRVLPNRVTPTPEATASPRVRKVEKPKTITTPDCIKVEEKREIPKTGDDTLVGIWIVAAVVAFAVIIGMCCKSVKE